MASGIHRVGSAAALALFVGCGGRQVVEPPPQQALPGALGSASVPIVAGTSFRLVVVESEASLAWVGVYGGGLRLAPVRDLNASIELAAVEWRLGDVYETPQTGDAALLVGHTAAGHQAALWSLDPTTSRVTEVERYAGPADAHWTWAAHASGAGYVVALGITGAENLECRLPDDRTMTLTDLGSVEALRVEPVGNDGAIAVINETGGSRFSQQVWPTVGAVEQSQREFFVSGWMADAAREATAAAAGCRGAGPDLSVRDTHGWTTACLYTAPDGAQFVNLAWELATP